MSLYPLAQSADVSPRWGLPFLFSGQSQKEMFHNDALFLIDSLISPYVLGEASDPSILSPNDGNSWIISPSAIGDFAGKDGQIAVWSANGWRFLEPSTGMWVFDATANCCRVFKEDSWTLAETVAPPSGGSVIDVEARLAISEIINCLIARKILVEP